MKQVEAVVVSGFSNNLKSSSYRLLALRPQVTILHLLKFIQRVKNSILEPNPQTKKVLFLQTIGNNKTILHI